MRPVAHGSSFPQELEELFAASPNGLEPLPFGYLFPSLQTKASLLIEDDATVAGLRELGETMRTPKSDVVPFSTIPSIYTYFGQFVDHDITFFDRPGSGKPLSKDFVGDIKPANLKALGVLNKRSSQLQLDLLYNGAELEADGMHLKIGVVTDAPGGAIPNKDEFNDVPRMPFDQDQDHPRAAQIGDPRNDNNLILSQLHVAFLRAHNALVDQTNDFQTARSLLRQHYHWVLIHDFLKQVCDEEIVEDILNRSDPLCNPEAENFCLPLEFTVAAYRFGHGMIRKTYYYSDRLPGVSFNALVPLMQMKIEGGESPTLPNSRIIQWERFVGENFPQINGSRNFARRIGTTLVKPLFNVLDANGKALQGEVNLAKMDLLRGYMLTMPTGQAVARELIAKGRTIPVLTDAQIVDAAANTPQKTILEDSDLKFSSRTPLWFYLMAEADRLGGGNRLGPVGSTLVAEVLIALVRRSPESILPKIGAAAGPDAFVPMKTASGKFKLADLLRLAEVLPQQN